MVLALQDFANAALAGKRDKAEAPWPVCLAVFLEHHVFNLNGGGRAEHKRPKAADAF